MLKLTENILKVNELRIMEVGVKDFSDHYDIYVLDEWLSVYLNEEAKAVCDSLKEILKSPGLFKHISEKFNIVLLEAILSSLIESDYKYADALRKDAVLNQYIYI